LKQLREEGVLEISLTSSPLMKEIKRKSDWINGGNLEKVKKFYFDVSPTTVQFDSDILVVSSDKFLHFYDSRTLESFDENENSTIKNDSIINCLQFDDNKMMIGDAHGYISLINMNNRKILWKGLSDESGLESLQFNSKNMVVCSGWSKNINIWDLEIEDKYIEIKDAHKEPITASKFVKNNDNMIVSCSYDQTVKLFDIRTSINNCIYTMEFGQIPSSVEYSNDGITFAVGGSKGSVSIFDMRELGTFNDRFTIRPHRSVVTSLYYDGYKLLSGSWDQKIVGWDIENNEKNFSFKTGTKVLCFHFDGSKLAIGLDNKKLLFYDFANRKVNEFDTLRRVYSMRI